MSRIRLQGARPYGIARAIGNMLALCWEGSRDYVQGLRTDAEQGDHAAEAERPEDRPEGRQVAEIGKGRGAPEGDEGAGQNAGRARRGVGEPRHEYGRGKRRDGSE